jgi:hypothetical protein
MSTPDDRAHPVGRCWTMAELQDELRRFEADLRAAGLKENSVATYVGRSQYFLSWLVGEYTPGVR